MSAAPRDESRLRAELRAALAADEPRQVPPFPHVFTRASAVVGTPRRGAWRPAAAAAAVVVAAVAAWLAVPRREPDAESDYRLAVAVVAQHGRGTPTDRWLEQAPSASLSGLPDFPHVEYPLVPEETLL